MYEVVCGFPTVQDKLDAGTEIYSSYVTLSQKNAKVLKNCQQQTWILRLCECEEQGLDRQLNKRCIYVYSLIH